ncbi:MAG: biotin/lipoyl-containing protein, partial [Gaiellaceae bacterium]
YDPMIAKLIARGSDRAEALARLREALDATEVGGLVTNLPFLRWLVAHPDVAAGRTTTAFLVENPPLSRPPARTASSPWRTPWRLNLPAPAPRPPPDPETAAGRGVLTESSTVTAPMPGTVISVLVTEGDTVEPRQALLVLEAMKMETPLVSPYAATVRRVHVSEGERVAGGAVLIDLEE